jgi:N-acetylglucosaminyldiphosphoundecaprenol N-acetyl-beta-D-mannosaminyltransferase
LHASLQGQLLVMKQTASHGRNRVSLFGIHLDPLTMPAAVNELLAVLEAPQRASHYVVTPNTDHIVMLQSDAAFREAYVNAFLVLADGKPVVLASRLLGTPLPETVPGSDLVPALLTGISAKKIPVKVFLFGAGPGVALKAKEHIHAQWGNSIRVVGATSPAFGFEHDAEASASHAREIAQSGADILLIGVGAPKQELWAFSHRAQLNVKLVLCVGATIDFLAGEKKRSPLWMQKTGLEWFYRMCQEPKRLVRRYARDASIFPFVVLREAYQRFSAK